MWMDVDDVYQEFYAVALRCFSKWNPQRGSFSTFLFKSLDNYSVQFVSKWWALKRRPGYVVDVSEVDNKFVQPSHESLPDPLLMALFEGAF